MLEPMKPDWTELVRERLAGPRSCSQDVVTELAAHLEEVYEQARAGQSSEAEAMRLALEQVDDWHVLAVGIARAKSEEDSMNHRTKTILLPALAILFGIGLVLLLLDRAAILQRLVWIACMALLLCAAASEANRLNLRTRSLWLPVIVNLTLTFGLFIILDCLNFDEPGIATVGNIARAFRIPWLLPLPVLGAVGALLARRTQASRTERLVAGLAPSLVWLAVLAVLGLVLVCDRRDFAGFPLHYLTVSAVGLVIVPALALSLGALPFLTECAVELRSTRQPGAAVPTKSLEK